MTGSDLPDCLRLRPAVEADLAALLAILDGAAAWLGRQGTDQWAGSPWRAEELRPGLATGALRVAEMPRSAGVPGDAGAPVDAVSLGEDALPSAGDVMTPVATMTLGDVAPSLWAAGDDPSCALYVSHLAVDRRLAGFGVGAWVLDEAAREAARRGKRALRLDAWTSNSRLHSYYRLQGFRLVRVVGGGSSGALFERAVSPR
jgi:GNAT superfamily N-acetyltransferase